MILQSKEIVKKLQTNGINLIKKYLSKQESDLTISDTNSVLEYLNKLFNYALIGSLRYQDYLSLSNKIANDNDALNYFIEIRSKDNIQKFLEKY